MNIICPKSIPGCPTYPGIPAEADFPITNISSEAPDQLIFTSPVWPRYVPPYDGPIINDPTFWAQDCFHFLHSATSQEAANLSAFLASLVLCPPPPAEEKLLFTNDEQVATAVCPGGIGSFSYHVPAGTFVSPMLSAQDGLIWKEQANAQALAYAQQQVSNPDLKVCIDCPQLRGEGGWICLNDEFDPSLNLFTVVGSNSSSDYNFTISSGNLPPGSFILKLSHNSAALEGIPTVAGTYHYTIRATRIDLPSVFAEVSNTMRVVAITNTTLPDATVGTAYDEQLLTAGTSGTVTFTLLGTLPPGLSMDSSGHITGTPT